MTITQSDRDADLLLEARQIVKATLTPDRHSRCNCREEIDAGEWDKGQKIRATLAGLHRGIEIAATHREASEAPLKEQIAQRDARIAGLEDTLARLRRASEAKIRRALDLDFEGTLDWEGQDEDLLMAWRKSGGEAAMGDWEWWGKPAFDPDEYILFGATRQALIEEAARDPDLWPLKIVEARCWADTFREEQSLFAETRNEELITQIDALTQGEG